MGIHKESQALRRNSEKASKVSSFSALGAVNGFSWAEGSFWNSTANLRNQGVGNIYNYLCNIKVRSILLEGYLSSGLRESIPTSRSGENSRGLSEGEPGLWSPLQLRAPYPLSHNIWLIHPTTCISLNILCCLLFHISLPLHMLLSLLGMPSPDLWQCNECHTYKQNCLFPKRLSSLWVEANLTYLSTPTI